MGKPACRGRKIRDDGAIDDDIHVDYSRVRGDRDAHFKYLDALLLLYRGDARDLVAHVCANQLEFSMPVLRALAVHLLSGAATLAPYASKADACETLRKAVGAMSIRDRLGRYVGELLDIPKQIVWSDKILSRWSAVLRPYFQKELMQYVALADKPQLSVLYGFGRNPLAVYDDLVEWKEMCDKARVDLNKLAGGQRWSVFKVGRGANPPFHISNLSTKQAGMAQILAAFLDVLVQRQEAAVELMLKNKALKDALRHRQDAEDAAAQAVQRGIRSGIRSLISRRRPISAADYDAFFGAYTSPKQNAAVPVKAVRKRVVGRISAQKKPGK
jgi:hypothetical protein